MSSNKSGGMRVLTFVLIVLLLLAIFGGVIGIGYAYGWFGGASDEEQSVETEDGGAIISEKMENGISIMSTRIAEENYAEYGVSLLAESAYTLTASVTPSYVYDQTVDWSVAFADSSSEWASGKTVTDYVTVTPTSDGALTAVVENLQSFGEQIVITVTSRNNSSAKATCTVDYVKRVDYITVQFTAADATVHNGGVYNEGDTFTAWSTPAYGFTYYNYSVVYTDYTIDDTYTITVSSSVYADALSQLSSDTGYTFEGYKYAMTESSGRGFTGGNYSPLLLQGHNAISSSSDAYAALIEWLIANIDTPLFCFVVDATGTSYGNVYSYDIPVYFDADKLVSVTGVSISETEIIF